jgi:nucleotide-binding universal stress UspA family protein
MQTILVGLDGSPLAETILPFLELLAKKTGAGIALFHVVPVPTEIIRRGNDAGVDQLLQTARLRAEAYLAEHRRRLSGAGLRVSAEVVIGQPARGIVEHAERNGFDLIALATHGRSGVDRWAHGSVTDQVLHSTKIPLLLIRPGDDWTAAPREPHRVAVMLDGSPESEIALDIAVRLATQLGIPLGLLRFVEPTILEFGDPMGMAYVDVERITSVSVEAAREYLRATAAELRERFGVDANPIVAIARPEEGIGAYVRDHPDTVVVLATHGRTGWRRIMLGSVARRLIQTVAAPIVICPPREGAVATR